MTETDRNCIDSELDRLQAAGLVDQETLVGCSAEEIEAVEDEHDVALPERYSDWLSVAGRECGEFIRGSDRGYPAVLGLTGGLRALLEADDASFTLEQRHFAFVGHQGYVFLYFDATAGENPPVYRYLEGDGRPEQVCESFTEWLAWTVEDEISLATE